MGRWLNKIRKAPDSELTKPTEPGCVSFGSVLHAHFGENSHLQAANESDPEAKAIADPLDGLELLPDDRRWIEGLLIFKTEAQRLALLQEYRQQWEQAYELEKKEHAKTNRGRFAANTWLRMTVNLRARDGD